ncbi:RNA ligase family protein [Streptomyces sp. NPDC059835]|uniref:RNA ligase family protein n=1 Tax=Streptomyces sp. NPDC059835 TaxID=3346967 RepID=UPI00365209C0
MDLPALDSATKYPSIGTNHQRKPKGGRLLEQATAFSGEVTLTEKVDGTNARIITFPDGDYVIGARDGLLYGRGDLVANQALGIVNAQRPLADRITPPTTGIRVHYLELYRSKIGPSHQYTGTTAVGFRLFDLATFKPTDLDHPIEKIASWRDRGSQHFYSEARLAEAAMLDSIPLTPRLATITADDLPAGVQGMQDFLLHHLPTTRVALDKQARGRPEGIVLRTADRSVIAKARFADYQRTLAKNATS